MVSVIEGLHCNSYTLRESYRSCFAYHIKLYRCITCYWDILLLMTEVLLENHDRFYSCTHAVVLPGSYYANRSTPHVHGLQLRLKYCELDFSVFRSLYMM